MAETLLLDKVIYTDYRQLDLIWSEEGGFDGDAKRFFSEQVNGLVGAGDPHGVHVILGRRSGGSHVRISTLATKPLEPDAQWEDVVEVSIEVPSGAEVKWNSWAGETEGPLALPAGSYRLRVSARGRDAGAADEFADDVLDYYRLELWPAPHGEDAILRVSSDDARYWHSEFGGRR